MKNTNCRHRTHALTSTISTEILQKPLPSESSTRMTQAVYGVRPVRPATYPGAHQRQPPGFIHVSHIGIGKRACRAHADPSDFSCIRCCVMMNDFVSRETMTIYLVWSQRFCLDRYHYKTLFLFYLF